MKANLKHTPVEIIQYMTHDSLNIYKVKNSKAPIHKIANYQAAADQKYKKGAVFVAPTKEHLSHEDGARGYVVTSYETLHQKCNEVTHWTPNTFRGGSYYNFSKRIIKGHSNENLKQINVIGFDIDTKNVDLYALFLGCDELDLPRPNLLLETPGGYQGFFILETPFYISPKENYKALRVAERICKNIWQALNTYVPIDFNCRPFGFFRMPNNHNVIYYDEKPANTNMLIYWSKDYDKKIQKSAFSVVYKHSDAQASAKVSAEWYRDLINCTEIHSGYKGSSRNNTLYTLALANYQNDVPFDQAFDELDQFNSNLDSPLSNREFTRVLKSAYSGRKKGANRESVERLIQLWTNGQASFSGTSGWYKFKKPREERIRSHYEERENDIIIKLETLVSPENPFYNASLAELAEVFGMALSTLKEVLKRSDKLIKKTIGRGRGAVTKITSRSILFKSFLKQRQARIKHVQMTFEQLLPHTSKTLEAFDIPYLFEELEAFSKKFEALPGASPPDRLII